MSNLIRKALISEKSYLQATAGKFTFLVDQSADKETIAKTIEKLFKVNVISVNSSNYEGKIKSTRRSTGKRSNFKKVVLTLKPGQKIDLFELENTEDKEKKEKAAKAKDEKKEEKAAPKKDK